MAEVQNSTKCKHNQMSSRNVL